MLHGITGRLVFVTAVTCYLLDRVRALLETVVYGATAAFGVEFVLAS